MTNNYRAEKDIKYVFDNCVKLITKKDINDITIFINDDLLACGFIRQNNKTPNEYQKLIQDLGKQIKPKITVMVSNSQMTIAHHMSKLTSIFVLNDENEWEEVW